MSSEGLFRLGRRVASRVAPLMGLAVALALTARAAYAQEGSVAGVVVTQGTQRPIAGAQITVQGQAGKGAMSDASGRFRVSGLTGTDVTLNVRMLGYRA